eukprot:Tamp_00375.p2 GENE.Tamp_00375~~Tamp_00375.p2  ORF type:complete len:861 (+),score=154.95 Tamp_00375:4039-6621(+)
MRRNYMARARRVSKFAGVIWQRCNVQAMTAAARFDSRDEEQGGVCSSPREAHEAGDGSSNCRAGGERGKQPLIIKFRLPKLMHAEMRDKDEKKLMHAQDGAADARAAQRMRKDKGSERQMAEMRTQQCALVPRPAGSKRRAIDAKRTLNTIFEGAVQAMWDEDMSAHFRAPFNHPGYRALIANPIDLQTIRDRCYGSGHFDAAGPCLSHGLYDSKDEFLADIALMVSNCRAYNQVSNPQLVSDVLVLEKICHAKLEESKSAIVEAEAMMGLGRKLAAWTQELLTSEVEQPQTPTSMRVREFEAFATALVSKEYTNVVKQPMDLKTMLRRAESYSYCSHRGWLEDLKLVRDNCHLFCATRYPDLPPIADTLLARGEAFVGGDADMLQTLEGQVAQRERARVRLRESKKERERKREQDREKIRKRLLLAPRHQPQSWHERSTLPLRWTRDEDALLVEVQARLQKKWKEIAKFLPGRSPGAIHSRWNKLQAKMMPWQRTQTAAESAKSVRDAVGSCGQRRESSKRQKLPPALFIIENSIDILCQRSQQRRRPQQQQWQWHQDDKVTVRERAEQSRRRDEDPGDNGKRTQLQHSVYFDESDQDLDAGQEATAAATGGAQARLCSAVDGMVKNKRLKIDTGHRFMDLSSRQRDKTKDASLTGCLHALQESRLHTAAAQARDSQSRMQKQKQLQRQESVASHAVADPSTTLVTSDVMQGGEEAQKLHVRAAMQLPAQQGDFASQQDEDVRIYEFDSERSRSEFMARWKRFCETGAARSAAQDADTSHSSQAPTAPGTVKECCNALQLGAELVGERIRVYWDGDRDWFAGYVSRYCARKKGKPHFVQVGVLKKSALKKSALGSFFAE